MFDVGRGERIGVCKVDGKFDGGAEMIGECKFDGKFDGGAEMIGVCKFDGKFDGAAEMDIGEPGTDTTLSSMLLMVPCTSSEMGVVWLIELVEL